MIVNRRKASAMSVGALTAAAMGLRIGPAGAANNAEELMRQFTRGRAPRPGRIMLDLPEIAENGNTIPIGIKVESPMTEASHVTGVLIIADQNPSAGVLTLRLSPLSGVAEVNTRIRLAESQNVIALATMSDGAIHQVSKYVKVTIGGCGG